MLKRSQNKTSEKGFPLLSHFSTRPHHNLINHLSCYGSDDDMSCRHIDEVKMWVSENEQEKSISSISISIKYHIVVCKDFSLNIISSERIIKCSFDMSLKCTNWTKLNRWFQWRVVEKGRRTWWRWWDSLYVCCVVIQTWIEFCWLWCRETKNLFNQMMI